LVSPVQRFACLKGVFGSDGIVGRIMDAIRLIQNTLRYRYIRR